MRSPDQKRAEDYSIRLQNMDIPPTKAWVRSSSPTHLFSRRFDFTTWPVGTILLSLVQNLTSPYLVF